MAFSRSAWPEMMRTKRCAASGSSRAPSSRVSAKPLMEVTGVLSSCETLATKSRRTASRRLSRVTSLSTTTAPTRRRRRRPCSSVPLACSERSSAPTRIDDVGLHRLGARRASAPTTRCRSGLRTTSWMRLALGRRRVDVEQRGGGLVEGDHALVRVDGEHALDHAREHRFALVALAGERARSCSSSSSAMRLRLSATRGELQRRAARRACGRSRRRRGVRRRP